MGIRDALERIHSQHANNEDWRTPAQVDVDRVWYAPEFRRLEGVTQVVPPQDDYVFHDRLTHSVKVAQVAATLARRQIHIANDETSDLYGQLAEHGIDIADWISPDHCYVAGLAHDIGHPPYGHAGEAALQKIGDKQASSLGGRSFEGNAQSTRIVASLSFRKPRIDGLDLTLRSLASIAKYPWLRGEHPTNVPKLAKKWSFYPEERYVLDLLRRRGFVREVRGVSTGDDANGIPMPGPVLAVHRWPEAEIMDWADDISYAVHDLEDFYRAGRIPLHRIASSFSNAPESYLAADNPVGREGWATSSLLEITKNDEEVRAALLFARAKMAKTLDESGESLAHHVPDAFVEICDVLRRKMPTNRFDGSKQAHTDLQRFASEAITYLSSKSDSVILQVGGETRIGFRVDPTARVVAEFFKAVCQYYVIESSALATMQYGQALALERTASTLVEMTLAWLERKGDVSYQNSLPARLREYVKARSSLSGGFRSELDDIAQRLRAKDLEEEVSAELKSRMESILREERAEIYVCVFDYLCGLRDLQTSILEERLFGNKSSLSLSSSWLDI